MKTTSRESAPESQHRKAQHERGQEQQSAMKNSYFPLRFLSEHKKRFSWIKPEMKWKFILPPTFFLLLLVRLQVTDAVPML